MKNVFYLLLVVWLFAACKDECLVGEPPAYDVAELNAPAIAEVGKQVQVECTITYGDNDCASTTPKTGAEVVTVYYSYAPQHCNQEAACYTTFRSESSLLEADLGNPQNDFMWYNLTAPGFYCCRVEVQSYPLGPVVAEKMVFTESY